MGVHSMIKVRRLLGAPLAAASLSLGVALAGTVALPGTALALDLSSITQTDASAAVKAALQKGAESAVASLGKADGFLGNPEVKIPLPSSLQKLEKAAKLMGKQKDFEALQVNINRAAEAAVPEAKTLLLNAIKGMSVKDAKGILAGGDDSVTSFFREKTSKEMYQKFLPIVTQYTGKKGLAKQYNSLAGRGEVGRREDRELCDQQGDGWSVQDDRGGREVDPCGSGGYGFGHPEEGVFQVRSDIL